MKKTSIRILLCFFGIISAKAQQNTTKKDSTSLEKVLIQSTSIEEEMQSIPAAVNYLDSEELTRTSATLLTESFNRKPGVFTQEGALNTNRISIRGIGARAQYGTNRVKAYFNEIPISSGDGQTVINDIAPESIDHVEIIKGPNSSIYGSGLGGVINLYAKKPRYNESFAEVSSTFGSYQLVNNSVNTGFSSASGNIFANYTHIEQDGYRENSAYDRKSLTLNGNLYASTKSTLSFIGNFTRLKAFIPSSISETDFNENPSQAAFTWKQAKGFESYDKVLFGMSYSYQFSENFKNSTSIFINYKDAYEPRPFDILKEESYNLGVRTRFNFTTEIFKLPLKTSFGAEILNENYSGSNFENLYEDFPGEGSVRGNTIAYADQNRNYYNFFGQVNLSLSKRWKIEAGININQTDYEITDLFAEDEIDQSGNYQFNTEWSPRIAALYKISSTKNLYASISKGFSIPTVDETLTPEGRINTTLNPETGWNYEIGFKGTWFKNLYTEISLYTIQVSDLLVARRVAEDRYVGINAGKTDHNGLEILLNYNVELSDFIRLKPYFSASFNEYSFDEFTDQGNNYSGNELTGVPDKKINLGLDVQTKNGFSFYSNALFVSEIPLNDENSKYSDAYQLVNLKAAYELKAIDFLRINFQAGINNVFNEQYAVSILPNAIGFGNSEPRYYYPGNPRNYYGGVGVKFLF
ncbi:TonB-dependent receptor family protein [Mesonia maritima]|uniref:Iron complex outermembrane receptor protein n=1 Tax=Mesonia maritima TaxID=1793873 RepID=A0ABU1K7B9_9FLAO|nr:TonB-dependent receptor [Mesonia maritima]MDR6301516.1 iron complex outermembrane receptor protein [Mesonia maritima]